LEYCFIDAVDVQRLNGAYQQVIEIRRTSNSQKKSIRQIFQTPHQSTSTNLPTNSAFSCSLM
jgi:hypothetical protein